VIVGRGCYWTSKGIATPDYRLKAWLGDPLHRLCYSSSNYDWLEPDLGTWPHARSLNGKISIAELVKSHERLSEVAAVVEKGIRGGRNLEQLKESNELPAIPGADVKHYVEQVFAEMTRK